jgi:hypothetical protein
VPITLLFSGSVFYQAGNRLQAAPIPWHSEARFALPVQVWRDSVDRHYPNTAWVCLSRCLFDRLYECKVREGAATVEETLERLLEGRLEAKA